MKAQFTSRLVVSPVHGKDLLWVLDAPLEYQAGEIGAGRQDIHVPRNFVTDFASIPRVFWRVIVPSGMHREAAVVHDWLYYCGDRSKAVCDAIFLEAMTALDVPKWKRNAMFLAVLFFAGFAWRSHRRAGHSFKTSRHD